MTKENTSGEKWTMYDRGVYDAMLEIEELIQTAVWWAKIAPKQEKKDTAKMINGLMLALQHVAPLSEVAKDEFKQQFWGRLDD